MDALFHKYPDHQQLSKAVADEVVGHIRNSQTCLLGLATGFSTKQTYSFMAEEFDQNPSLITNTLTFQLDEWYGLSRDMHGSCAHYLNEHVIHPWKIPEKNCFLIDGLHANHKKQILIMQSKLKERCIDVCILGIGKNGHLAFNEPGSSSNSQCRIVDLDYSSTAHTMVSHIKDPVQKGITIGLNEIMASKEIILIVTGEGKKEAFQKLLNRLPIEEFPASVLYNHSNWKCFVDLQAIS